MITGFKSIVEVQQAFPTDTHCREYLKLIIWGGEPQGCVHCGATNLYSYADNHRYRCKDCNLQFNVLHGTIFEGSHVSLVKWFMTIYLASSLKRGISSHQLAKIISVTQKTAWFMMQRVRKMFKEMKPEALSGTVMVDETYVGGKYKNKHKNKRKPKGQGRAHTDKVLVFGAMEDGGRIVTAALPRFGERLIINAVKQNVVPGSFVISDELRAYKHMGNNYRHVYVNHSWYQYVNDEGHTTNPIENAWSHLKRTIIGTHYHVSPKHLPRYLAEFEYKFNTRNIDEQTRLPTLLAQCGVRLKYKDLIAA